MAEPCLGNGLPNRRLADTRGAHEAEDLPSVERKLEPSRGISGLGNKQKSTRLQRSLALPSATCLLPELGGDALLLHTNASRPKRAKPGCASEATSRKLHSWPLKVPQSVENRLFLDPCALRENLVHVRRS